MIGANRQVLAAMVQVGKPKNRWRCWTQRLLFLFFSVLLPACSCRDEGADSPRTQAPPKQAVSATDTNALLRQGHTDNLQIAAQLERLKKPFGGQLSLELNLADTYLEDEELFSLTLPDSLTRVDLSRTLITDDGLAHLVRGKNIVDLILVDTRITSEGVEHLRAMPRLRNVQLHDTDIPVDEQLKLQKYLMSRKQ
jgi:hypothetical protein